MSQPSSSPKRQFPRVPAYAWTWLQRSRPVVAEAARRLTGGPPSPGFVDELRARVEQDAFTRDVLIGVIADVAFGGRLPTRRPAAVTWDRGLTWWAAAIAGLTPAEFEARSATAPGQQRPLFEAGTTEGRTSGPVTPQASRPGATPAGEEPTTTAAHWATSPERVMMIRALRELLGQAEGDQVPASAVRQLLAQLEGDTGWRDRGAGR